MVSSCFQAPMAMESLALRPREVKPKLAIQLDKPRQEAAQFIPQFLPTAGIFSISRKAMENLISVWVHWTPKIPAR